MTTPFTAEDLFLHHKVTELECSPAAAMLACTVRSVDREGDGYHTLLWALGLDGSRPRQLTHGPGHDKSPRWSPDGRQLAFLSDRSGGTQVHVLPMEAGEARQLSRFEQAVSDARWHPSGRSLVATVAVQVDPDAQGARGAVQKERGPKAPEVAWKLPYKGDGIGYILAREIHLFSLDAGSGESRQLTDGAFDVLACDISPNGRHIAYVRTRGGRFSHRTDLWVCDGDGTRHRQLTRDLAMVLQPAWSPDGRWIAFAGAREEGDSQTRLWALDFASAELRPVGDESLMVADGDRLHWTEDSASLVLAKAHRGRHEVVRVQLEGGGEEMLLAGDRQFGGFVPCGPQLAFIAEHPAAPSEVFACRAGGASERQLSDFNPWWRERTPIEAQVREFRVPDGRGGSELIEGWLLRSRDARAPTPLLDDVHGGPASYALLDYDSHVYWQVLCSRGWSVLALNAVGSSSYGREFCDRLMGRWGELDLPQHLAAVRELQSEGVCDHRLAICGKSYGGYLSSWAVGNTEQFQSAVVMAPVGNIETHYGTSDGGYYADPFYMGAGVSFDRGLARQLSPMHHVEEAQTPTLFLQGKEDERCPKCQAEELFVSLMRAGDTPAELVLYPDEGHAFLGEGAPSVRADAAQRIVAWVERFTRAAPRAAAADEQQKVAEPTSG